MVLASTALQPSAIGTTVQAYDADLANIASLTTTTFGRSLLTQADAAATRTTLGLGTAATTASTAYATAAQGTLASTALQPAAIGTTVQAYDADLANIASLTTTTFGRSLLTQADAAATQTTLGLGSIATQNANAVAITGGSATLNGGLTVSSGTVSITPQITTSGLIINTDGTVVTTGVGTGAVEGNARGTGAVDLQTSRTANTQVASGSNSFLAGLNNTASGTNSVCLGSNSTASNSNSISIGSNCRSGNSSTISLNVYARAKRNGEVAIAAGRFSSGTGGDAQTSVLVVRGTTTDATPVDLSTGAGTFISLENDSTLMFQINVVARRTDVDNESAMYVLRGGIDRNTNAASTALVGPVEKTVLAEDAAAWDVSVSADTTNGALRITATGEAAKSIRWVATCYFTEVQG